LKALNKLIMWEIVKVSKYMQERLFGAIDIDAKGAHGAG
jgi:hypothetical protein